MAKLNNDNVFANFLEVISVKHTRTFSNKFFKEHPHRNNLYGLSKMLTDYGIENKCLKFTNKDRLSDLEPPFIAHIWNDFVIVTKISENNIDSIWNGDQLSTNYSDFNSKWSGVVLLAETNENSIEPNYKTNRKSELFADLKTYTLYVAFSMLIAAWYVKQQFISSLYLNMLLIVNLLGAVVGFLLLQKQINSKSNYVDAICSLFGGVHGCNDILQSKASKFLGLISWSEIGFAYFISNILLILFSPEYIAYAMFINVFALPYSIWSVWYQSKHKQWCVLCLVTMLIIWCIFLINKTFGHFTAPAFTFFDTVAVFTFYMLPLLLISIIIPKFSESNKVENLNYEINNIKADEDAFLAILKKQERYDVGLSDSKIIWGNPNAKVFVTVLSNPHCEPCRRMHFRLEKLLKYNSDKLCVQYIFSFFDKYEELTDSNRFLISAYCNSSAEESAQIYNEWFEHSTFENREKIFKKYNFSFDANVEKEFLKHNSWIDKTKLMATPTILINGYELPKNFKIEDVRYLSDCLRDMSDV